MKIQVAVFWVASYIVVVGYQSFGEPYCLHLQGDFHPEHCVTTQKTSTLLVTDMCSVTVWKKKSINIH